MKWKTFFLIILDFHQFVSDDNGYPTLCGSRSQITRAKNADGQVITTIPQVYAHGFSFLMELKEDHYTSVSGFTACSLLPFVRADLSCNMGEAVYRSTYVIALRPFIC
jgi:hypothetical protein